MRANRSALLLVPAAVVLTFLFAAYLTFLKVSLATHDPGGVWYGPPYDLHNYARYLTSPNDLGVLAWTIVFSMLIAIGTVIIGYPAAYFIVRTRNAAVRNLVIGALIVTFLSGGITRAYGWLILLGNRGVVNSALLAAGIIDKPLALTYNLTGVSIALLHFLLPYFVLTLVGTIRSVPRQLEDAARDLGASPRKAFFKITLPLTLPGVVAAGTLIYSIALSTFTFPLLLGGGRVRLVSNAIYDQIVVASDQPFAAASAAIFLVVALTSVGGFVAVQRVVTRRYQPAVQP